MARRRLDSLSQMALQNVQAQRKAAGSYAQDILTARARFITLRLQKDQAIRRVYEIAADNVANEIRSLAPGGSPLRRRHLTALEKALRTLANDIDQGLTRELQDGIVQSVAAGVQPHAAITAKLLASAAGAGGPPLDMVRVQWLFAGVNQRAVEAIWSRVDPNGLRLSNRIWKVARRNHDVLRDLVVDAVARGRDAVALARDLEQYLKRRTPAAAFPNMIQRMGRRIPKDISYEALRLARTEMTAAFGEGTIAAGAVAPSYLGIKWVLSGAHPEPDVCDERARGGPNGNGVYPKGQEPAYPAHPNDLCTLIPLHEEPQDFVERLRKWRDNPGSDAALEDWYNNVYSQGMVPGGLSGSPAITALTAPTPPPPKAGQNLGARRTLVKGYTLRGNHVRDVVVYTGKDGVRLIAPADLDRSLQTLTIEDVRDALYKLPTRLRRLVREVQILDYANPDDLYWEQKYNIPGFRSFATGGGRTVQFYANGNHSRQSNLDFLPKAMNHEVGHLLDQSLAQTPSGYFSDSPTWSVARTSDAAHNQGTWWTSDYARASQSVREDFADAVDLWLRDADVMRKRFPYRDRILSREVKTRGR